VSSSAAHVGYRIRIGIGWNTGAVLIYKILLPGEWHEFEASGEFGGSPFDRTSGFVHCSARDQAGDTAVRVFGGEPELVVVAIDAGALGDSVRWEVAGDGRGTFPHVYGSVPLSAVAAVHRVAGAALVEDAL
jgi:uncharacterized protein (DUF952 family)